MRKLALFVALLPSLVTAADFTNVSPADAISVLIKNSNADVVRTLVSNDRSAGPMGWSGTIPISWDKKDDLGNPVPPGPYTATLTARAVLSTTGKGPSVIRRGKRTLAESTFSELTA